MMKKLLIPLLLLISCASFAQVSSVTLQVKGGNSVNIMPYTWAGKTSPDTLGNLKYNRANYLQLKNFIDSLNAHSSFFSNQFKGPGTSANPIRLQTDTIGTGYFVTLSGTGSLRKDTNHYATVLSAIYTSSNGITKTGNNFKLGGSLTGFTQIQTSTNGFLVQGNSATFLSMSGGNSASLQGGDGTTGYAGSNFQHDSLLFYNNNGTGAKSQWLSMSVANGMLIRDDFNHGLFYYKEPNYYGGRQIIDAFKVDSLITAHGRITTNPLTFNNSGTGDASGSTFNGSAAKTLSYNSIGAQAALVSGTNIKTINGNSILGSGNLTISGGGGSSLAPTSVKTTNYTAIASDYVPVNTTSGSITITLPTAPADKTIVGIKHIIQGSTNTVTIAAAGSDVFNKTGGSTSLTLPILNQGILLQYASATGIWYVTSDDLPLGGLDLRYAPIATSLAASNFVVTETPSGTINGTNLTFTLANTPTSGKVTLYSNGLLLIPTTNYTISGTTITMVVAPQTGDSLLSNYMK